MLETRDKLIWVRFYAELNDLLPSERRFVSHPYSCNNHATIGQIIADVGIPLSEVDLILVNGESVDSSYQPHDGDRVSIYPVFESFDISSLTKVRTKPLRHSRFVLDVHLGKLAYYLRMLGFDTLYRNDYRDEELIGQSIGEDRILLSKDRELLADERVTRGYHVREKHPREQLVEVLERFDLFNACLPLQRCIRCNVPLIPVDKAEVFDRLPPMVAGLFNEFQRCPACHRVYWKGSHYTRMNAFISSVLNSRDRAVHES